MTKFKVGNRVKFIGTNDKDSISDGWNNYIGYEGIVLEKTHDYSTFIQVQWDDVNIPIGTLMKDDELELI